MGAIRFFTDEDIYGPVAAKLRQRGHDAVSAPEAQRLGEEDPLQLAWAASEGRVIVTFNVTDFARLHHAWIASAQHHAGIIVSRQRPIGDLLSRLAHLAASLSAEEMLDRLEFLGNW